MTMVMMRWGQNNDKIQGILESAATSGQGGPIRGLLQNSRDNRLSRGRGGETAAGTVCSLYAKSKHRKERKKEERKKEEERKKAFNLLLRNDRALVLLLS